MTRYLLTGASILGGEPTDILLADGVVDARASLATLLMGRGVYVRAEPSLSRHCNGRVTEELGKR